MRKKPLLTQEIYHIYNRGVDKRVIFYSDRDHAKFVTTLRHYLYHPELKLSLALKAIAKGDSTIGQLEKTRTKNPLVSVLSCSLMPNHIHLAVKQLQEKGISKFMHKVCTSYAEYFNSKNERTGTLFQGRFKAVHVESDEQLICLSRYIHINAKDLLGPNPTLGGLINYPWSSLKYYLSNTEDPFDFCLSLFKDESAYKDFIEAELNDYQKSITQEVAID